MKTIVMVLFLTGAAWAQQRNVRQQEDPRPSRPSQASRPRGTAPEVSVRGGVELTYDDNIIDLSDRQLSQLHSGTRDEKFKIDQEEDFVTSPWAEFRLKAWLFKEATSFGLKVQTHAYADSSIANYEEMSLYARQDLGKHEMGLEYKTDLGVYHKELEWLVIGGGLPNIWKSAYYDEHEFEGYYRHRFAPWLTARGFAGYAIRDFESPWGHRDLAGTFVGVRPTVEVGDLSFFLQIRYRVMEADTSGTDEDTSYREQEFEPGVSVTLAGKKLELTLRHRIGLRDYTTNNDPAADPDHVDREDQRHRTTVEASYRIHKNWSVDGRYVRRVVSSDRPHDTGANADEADSERNLFVLGVSFNF